MVIVTTRTTVNTNNNVEVQNDSPFLFTCLNVMNIVTNFSLGAVVINAFIFANNLTSSKKGKHENNVVSQHVYLSVFGYVILMVQAIHSIDIHNGWARAFSCRNRKVIHYVLQIIGSVLALAGGLLIILDKSDHKHRRRLFQSSHGSFGLLALLFTIVSLITGLINLYSSNISNNKRILRLAHTVLGCFTLWLAFMTIAFGFNHRRFRYIFGDTGADLMIALTVISLIGTLVSPFLNLRRRP